MKFAAKDLIAWATLIFFVTGCSRGFFTTSPALFGNSPGQESSKLQITILKSNLGTPFSLENLTFQISNAQLSQEVHFLWSHALVVSGVSQLQTCIEENGAAAATYILNCSQTGALQVSLAISDQGGLLASDSMSWNVEKNLPPNQPAPSPTPVPPAVDGAALYSQKCQSCHGGLVSNNISNKSLSGIVKAIQSVGDMRSLSGLSSAETLAISNSLNNP